MALSSVRVLFNGKWTTLTKNASTGLYEGTVTAPSTPGVQTLTVRAVNSAGYQTEQSTALDVRWEIIPPVVQFTGPADESWCTSPRQPVSFTLRDEAGGSGVALDSLSFSVDGNALGSDAPGLVCTAVDGGYDCVYTPPEDWTEGTHSLSVSVRDGAGNESEPVSRSFHIDTLAPALALSWPPAGLITNRAELTVSGTVGDAGSGLAALTVNGAAVEPVDGTFSHTVALAGGTNTLTVTAADAVGHSSTITRAILLDAVPPKFLSVHIAPDLTAEPLGQVFVLTVVMADSFRPKSKETVTGTANGQPIIFSEGPELTWTAKLDRAAGDAYHVELYAADAAGNTAECAADFPCGMESKWDWTELDFLNYWDLNRVESNTDFLTKWMRERGYGAYKPVIRQDWTMPDIPTRSDIDRIRGNVDALREAFFRPEGWREIVYNNIVDAAQMNAIEWDLHLLDLWLDRAAKTHVPYSGQIFSGMWP